MRPARDFLFIQLSNTRERKNYVNSYFLFRAGYAKIYFDSTKVKRYIP